MLQLRSKVCVFECLYVSMCACCSYVVKYVYLSVCMYQCVRVAVCVCVLYCIVCVYFCVCVCLFAS